MEIELYTKTPVFIGNGDMLSNFDYIKNGNKLLVIKHDKILEDLLANGEISLEFIKVSSKNEILKIIDEKKEFILNNEKYIRYSIYNPFGFTPNENISEAIKTNNKLFIPGSTIKGAFTSALIFNLIKKSKDFTVLLSKMINECFEKPKFVEHKLEDFLKKNILPNGAKIVEGYFKDKKYSLFNHIFSMYGFSDITAEVVPELVKITRFGKNSKLQSLNSKYPKKKSVTSYLEAIPQNKFLIGTFFVRPLFYDEKINRYFLDLFEVETWDEQSIFSSLIKMVSDFSEYALNLPENFKDPDISFSNAKTNGFEGMLRIGGRIGFLQHTYLMNLKMEDPDLFRKLYQKLALGYIPRNKEKKVDATKFPSTFSKRNIKEQEQGDIGWLYCRKK